YWVAGSYIVAVDQGRKQKRREYRGLVDLCAEGVGRLELPSFKHDLGALIQHVLAPCFPGRKPYRETIVKQGAVNVKRCARQNLSASQDLRFRDIAFERSWLEVEALDGRLYPSRYGNGLPPDQAGFVFRPWDSKIICLERQSKFVESRKS